MFGRVVARGSGFNGIVQAEGFKEVLEHHAQVPDVGWIGPVKGEDDFGSGESGCGARRATQHRALVAQFGQVPWPESRFFCYWRSTSGA